VTLEAGLKIGESDMCFAELREMQSLLTSLDEQADALLEKLGYINTALESARQETRALPDLGQLEELTEQAVRLAGALGSAARSSRRLPREV